MKHTRTIVKRIICLVMIIMLLPVYDVPAYASSKEESRVIRIGYIDYEGFISKDKDGGFVGYGVEFLNEISKYTGWDYEFVYDTWPNQLESLRNGSIDFLCHCQITPERQEQYLFSTYSDGVESNLLYVRDNDDRYYYNDFSNFNGMKIGLLSNSYQNDQMESYAKKITFNIVQCIMKTVMKRLRR